MPNKLAVAAALAFPLLAPVAAVAQGSGAQSLPTYWGPEPWHMWIWHGSYGWHAFWMFPLAVLLVVLLFRALLVGRPDRTRQPGDDPARSALQILNERFARGEIAKEEYSEKKAALLSRG